MTAVCIWQMKYCTKSVLIATTKINKNGKTYIYFCADRNHPNLYSVDISQVKGCKIISNGKIKCVDVPFDRFINEGELPKELEEERNNQYQKFRKYTKK